MQLKPTLPYNSRLSNLSPSILVALKKVVFSPEFWLAIGFTALYTIYERWLFPSFLPFVPERMPERKGDEVITRAGFIGKITGEGDNGVVVLELQEKVRVRIPRAYIEAKWEGKVPETAKSAA